MDIIQQFSSANFALFPLNGKKPAEEKDWTKTEVDPGLCRVDMLGNYGVIVGPRLVLDVDCKKGQPGKESFKKLTKDMGAVVGWESETFVVKTGTGGFHVYLSLPKNWPFDLRKKYSQYPGIDFLHGNMYTVGPESVHPDTHKPYVVVFGAPGALLEAPEGLLTILAKKEVVTEGERPPEGFVDDSEINVDRFTDILNSMPEVPAGGRQNSAYIAACRGRDLGLSQKLCAGVLLNIYNTTKLIPPLTDDEIEEVTRNAYRYAKERPGHLNVGAIFKTTEVGEKISFGGEITYDCKNNVALKTLNNAVNYLITTPQLSEGFRFNAFSNMVEISPTVPWHKERGSRGPNICDEDVALLKYFLTKTIRVEFPREILYEAVVVVAHKRHYHPVRNYLDALVWDGVPRIDTWLTTYGHALDTIYTRAVARKVLCAAVYRVFHPGCKWDHVLIIEGVQGIGKSTLCRILGRSWSGDIALDPHSKDSVAMMLGKWVIELSEMTALRWADANALKSFITREKDVARLAYERHAKDFPRQSIFIGTVNPEHVGYLNDVTGNRRYWIIKFNGPVDLLNLENDCDQLWAEARAVYEKERLYLTGEAEQMQALEAQSRMPEDPMRQNVIRWSRENENLEVTPEVILEYLGIPMKSVTRADQNRIASALIEMGWEKKIERINGMFMTKYVRPLRERVALTMEEI